jgi:NAD(P)-dependent dehydrogenase (short-subunit alcohol dehydrogenase family)
MTSVIVVVGAGQIGQAIARRVGVGKHALLADMRPDSANAAAEVLRNAGYEASVATVDVSSREAVHALVNTAAKLGDVIGLIHAAGVSPTQASPATILKVDADPPGALDAVHDMANMPLEDEPRRVRDDLESVRADHSPVGPC